MNGFLISAVTVSLFVLCGWLIALAMDGSKFAAVGLCVVVFVVLGLVINYTNSIEAKGPYHKYETQIMYTLQ